MSQISELIAKQSMKVIQ